MFHLSSPVDYPQLVIHAYMLTSGLFSNDYLPGVEVVAYQLHRLRTRYPMLVMVTPNVSSKVRQRLAQILALGERGVVEVGAKKKIITLYYLI